MSEPLVVDLFVEDRAHEELLRPLVERAANEKRIVVTVRIRSARGGHGRALDEFRLYQRLVEGGAAPRPDLVVVGIDGRADLRRDARGDLPARPRHPRPRGGRGRARRGAPRPRGLGGERCARGALDRRAGRGFGPIEVGGIMECRMQPVGSRPMFGISRTPGVGRPSMGRASRTSLPAVPLAFAVSTSLGADADGDGLYDEWEVRGLVRQGFEEPLPAYGADPFEKDVFVEIDWMETSDGDRRVGALLALADPENLGTRAGSDGFADELAFRFPMPGRSRRVGRERWPR